MEFVDRREPLRFLDPAFGTGAFFSALLRVSRQPVAAATGFEIDAHYADDARRLWSGTPLRLHQADFTRAAIPKTEAGRSNLVVCNPPYVRHHHLTRRQKGQLRRAAAQSGAPLSGLSGLYCYFLVLSQPWMTRGATAAWLIPSELLDVNYGATVKLFLLERVTLLRIHRFDADDLQFQDALVSSCVIFFRNERPATGELVEFTCGTSLLQPRQTVRVSADSLPPASKWSGVLRRSHGQLNAAGTTLGDLFAIKRGLATGCNEFFIVSPGRARELQIPKRYLRPILPGPRLLAVDEIMSDSRGDPLLDSPLFLIDCLIPFEEVKRQSPALWSYLDSGRKQQVDRRYLCRHRTLWYGQERRPPAPLLCTYMGRSRSRNGRPFRFILNHSRATAANVYLMLYPKPRLRGLLERSPEMLRVIWQRLNAIGAETLADEGRVYGGGLHKLEPRELANVCVDGVLRALEETHG